LLLAALLFFGSEILLWTNPPSRNLIDWLLLIVGYVALSALLLEIAARYRLRDVYGLLMLAGVYGMANGLILNPQSALSDIPRTLISRAMGAHAFAGLVALALFLALTRGRVRGRNAAFALVAALMLGIGWGAWARWSPPALSGAPETPLPTILLAAGIGAGVIALAIIGLAMRLRRSPPVPLDLRLTPAEWAFTLVTLIALIVLRLLRGEVGVLALTIIVTLVVFSIMILWFQQRKKGATLLDGVGSVPPSPAIGALLLIGFIAAGVIGALLPNGGDLPALIGALFTAYGLIWLPAVSLVLGARAFSRQARVFRL
jgi:hypothetical protein